MTSRNADRPGPRRRAGPRLALLAAALLAAAAGPAFAGGDDGIFFSEADGQYYSRQAGFRIPFSVDATDRRIKQVLLHVSTNYGQTYERVAAAGPAEREFRFTAPRDGAYWFAVQTQDDLGRASPPDVAAVQPSLKVTVDTQPPAVKLNWLPPRDGQVGVEWEAVDRNLEPSSLRLDYRAAGGDWAPLPARPLAVGQYYWPPGAAAPAEVRLTVRDKAYNQAEVRTPPAGGGSYKPGPPAPGGPPDAAHDHTVLVNKRQIQLDYRIDDVGSSKVKAVEVWFTQDGKTWQRTDRDAAPEPPYVVEVGKEGRYGFTLIARSGVGLSEPPPKAGDEPQQWVEVDETAPAVKIQSVEVGRGPDAGTLTVRWSATDKHMALKPVTISYSEDPKGPWTPMAPGLPNDGRYVWKMPEGMPPMIYVRVTADDLAGNQGEDVTAKAVSTDLSIPKARVIGAKAAGKAP
jgi:hypothetical protein